MYFKSLRLSVTEKRQGVKICGKNPGVLWNEHFWKWLEIILNVKSTYLFLVRSLHCVKINPDLNFGLYESSKDLFIKNRIRTVEILVLFWFNFLWISLYFKKWIHFYQLIFKKKDLSFSFLCSQLRS